MDKVVQISRGGKLHRVTHYTYSHELEWWELITWCGRVVELYLEQEEGSVVNCIECNKQNWKVN